MTAAQALPHKALSLADAIARARLPLPGLSGMVTQVLGILVEGSAPGAAVGDFYDILGRNGAIRAEVVALRGHHVVLLPYGQMSGLQVGAALMPAGSGVTVAAGDSLLGRVIDAMGDAADGQSTPRHTTAVPLYRRPLSLTERRAVKTRLGTGVRALDAFVPLGQGQRMGIFAGPGVGKSTLLGMLARGCAADVVVLALVGERGREVGHFVDEVFSAADRSKAVVVSATSDRPASERVRAAFVATAIAEHFRDQGKNVLLFVDSLTRLCMAQRDIGLAIGEPPTSKGYPPSAFNLLPKLLERVAPAAGRGSITGVYSVLVEGDDMTEPVADAARGLLDGHIVLSRSLANRGHFPAINVLESLSRLEGDLLSPAELAAARRARGWLALAEESRELIAVGAYRPGSDKALDTALQKIPAVNLLLQQDTQEIAALPQTQRQLLQLAQDVPK
jgi:flagellum-specific ATP synthase